jgi:hypothetical protein
MNKHFTPHLTPMFQGAALPNSRIAYHYKVLVGSPHVQARSPGRPNQLESNANLDIIKCESGMIKRESGHH